MMLVLGTKSEALWTYSNEFNSYCVVGGVVYGANDSGVFIVDSGDDDAGTPIEASWSWGKSKLAPTNARVPAGYVSLLADGDVAVSLTCDEYGPYEYLIEQRDMVTNHRTRFKPAKGMVGQYWQVACRNVAGANFRIDNIELLVAPSARRVE